MPADDRVFFTRLHVRYNRASFPQDLAFQTTPNSENYQARYIITHPATGDLSCPAGQRYLADLKQRREDEMEMLNYLTGKNYSDWDLVSNTNEEKSIPAEASYVAAAADLKNRKTDHTAMIIVAIGVVGLAGAAGLRRRMI